MNLAHQFHAIPPAVERELSERERMVYELMAKGYRCQEIADAFCLSVKTVSTYHQRILDKMGFKTVKEFRAHMLAQGLKADPLPLDIQCAAQRLISMCQEQGIGSLVVLGVTK